MKYPSIPNTRILDDSVSASLLEAEDLPAALSCPPQPLPGSKNIFAFWHSGLNTLPPYLLRNVLSWYWRFSPLGWNIFVLDTVPDSQLNVSRYINTSDPSVVPEAFTSSKLSGEWVAQHTSDLIRYPLLLKYGGIYLDVGILQFGDLDWLWTSRIANPNSPYDFAGFTLGDPPEISIVNFAFMCGPDNPLVRRAHRILLQLWRHRTCTTGMSQHPLVSHVPLMHVPQEVVVDGEGEGKMVINDEVMTDYAIQIQAMGSSQRWVDEEDGWNGPKYVKEKAWLLTMIDGAFAHEQLTGWSGKRQLHLLSLTIPDSEDTESDDQVLARKIVESTVGKSWCLKLGHGFSAKLFGADTLGMLWRKNNGSDAKEGTYAGWLRWASVNCKQESPPKQINGLQYEPTMTDSLQEYLDS